MKPREDRAGIILSSEEADLAIKFDEAKRAQEKLRDVDQSLRSVPLGIELIPGQSEYILDDSQAFRLWRVAFWATTQYLEGYRDMSDHHQEICSTSDLEKPHVTEYLLELEVMLHIEAAHFRTAQHFTSALESARSVSNQNMVTSES